MNEKLATRVDGIDSRSIDSQNSPGGISPFGCAGAGGEGTLVNDDSYSFDGIKNSPIHIDRAIHIQFDQRSIPLEIRRADGFELCGYLPAL